MAENTRPSKRPNKENEIPPEILFANLDEIKEEFVSKYFEIKLVHRYIFFLLK